MALLQFVRSMACSAAVICLTLAAGSGTDSHAAQAQTAQQPPAQGAGTAKPVGTIKAISGNTITLTTDAGSDVTILIEDATKLVRIAPGQKDLKDATPIHLQDVQPGDRILVRGKVAEDGKSVLALSVIAMKKADVTEKQAHDREEWQKRGTGGLVSSVDAAGSTVTISLPAVGEKKSVAVHLSKDTVLRRYAPDSVKFDDAKPAPLSEIKPGDQLRARGTRNADGTELAAEEVVSGTFRNIAGTISALDASAGTITVQDLAANKPVAVKVTPDSQLRKLPPAVAQRIAVRLKGLPGDATPTAAGASTTNGAQDARAGGASSGGPGQGGPGGMGRSGAGALDLQQAINRLPASMLADFQKGEAVMLVATEGGPGGTPTAITLLGGVEPILQASPNARASTILSPWSLGSGAGGEAAAP
jgi:uncharacterized protein DUF5666